jgi:hypothetical protein
MTKPTNEPSPMNAFGVSGFAMWSAGLAFSELRGNWASKPLPALLYLVSAEGMSTEVTTFDMA